MTEGGPKPAEPKSSPSKTRSTDTSKSDRRSSKDKPAADRTVSTSSKSSRDHASKHSKTGSSSYASKASGTKIKLLVDPASHLSPNEKIDRVLLGETHIISYSGTSQYSQGAPSACGLAALNAIRIAFDKPLQGITGIDLIKLLSAQNTHLDATAICAHWSSRGHLEPDHLFDLPLFHQAMKVYARHDELVGFEAFLSMLKALKVPQAVNDVTAALITRPPEMVSVLRIPFSDKPQGKTPDGCIYAIFDSHSRPEHPTGAGLTLFPSITAAATHITALLRVNMNVRSSALQWEAQLMSQFSAHLVRRVEWRDPQQERATRMAAMYEANAGMLRALEAQEEVKRVRNEASELREKVKRLERELHHAYQALDTKPKPPDAAPGADQPSGDKQTTDPKYAGLSEDAILALRMQEEFDAEDQLLTQLAAEEPNAQNVFDCGICFDTFHTGALAPMEGCDHAYCRDCMRDYIKSKLGSRSFPILCPTCHAAKDGGTQGKAGQELVETIGLDEQEYATYVELSLASLSVMVHCRKCQRAAFVMRADLESQENEISCPLPDCDYKWCKNCNKSLEEGQDKHSCDGTSELRDLMAQEGWKECPGCKTPISRNEGCYHMTCGTPGCNSHFCYRCGALITQSLDRNIIQSAVNHHFRGKCTMFDSPVLSLMQRLRR